MMPHLILAGVEHGLWFDMDYQQVEPRLEKELQSKQHELIAKCPLKDRILLIQQLILFLMQRCIPSSIVHV